MPTGWAAWRKSPCMREREKPGLGSCLGKTEQVPPSLRASIWPILKRGGFKWPLRFPPALRTWVGSHQGNQDPNSIVDYFEMTESKPLASKNNPKWPPPHSPVQCSSPSHRSSRNTNQSWLDSSGGYAAYSIFSFSYPLCTYTKLEKGKARALRPDPH